MKVEIKIDANIKGEKRWNGNTGEKVRDQRLSKDLGGLYSLNAMESYRTPV